MIETIEAGEVIGWSWLFPPYRWHFDARALTSVRATGFDGACLRAKCDDDPALGYDLMSRFAQVLIERLQWTRLRLLDVYGDGDPQLSLRPAGRDDAACRSGSPSASRTRRTPGRYARAARRRRRRRSRPGQFVMVYAFGIGEVPISVSGPPSRPGPSC